MTSAQAGSLVAFLVAAYWPRKVPDDTVRVYARRLERFDYPVARAAVERLLDEKTYWPALAEIAEAYWGESRRRRLEADRDPLPPVTDRERAENIRRIGLLVENLGRPRAERDEPAALLRRMGLWA